MATALVVPISGPYTATWRGQVLGTQDDNGFVLTNTFQGQEINQSDAYGLTLVEAIWRGMNWRCRFRALEWNKAGILNLIQAFGSTGDPTTTFTPELTNIGDRYSKFAYPLVLTSVLGNPPTYPQTLTANSAIIAPQSNTEAMMTSKMREGPLELVLLPYSATVGSLTQQNVPFTTT